MKTTAKLAGAAVVVGSAGTVGTGLMFPQANGSVTFADSSYGNGLGPKVLVAYASEFGTTGEVAQAVAARFCQAGATTDTKRIRDVGDLSIYDAVVIGGAIQYENWMSEARDFVTRNEAVLSTIHVAYFFTCAALSDPSPKAIDKANGYADKLEAVSHRVNPVSIGRFAGVLDYNRMNLRTRIGLRVIFTVMGVNEGDYRDWNAINAWSDSITEMPNQRGGQ